MTTEKIYEMFENNEFKNEDELKACLKENNIALNDFISYAIKQPRELADDELDLVSGGTGVSMDEFKVMMQRNDLVWVDHYASDDSPDYYHMTVNLGSMHINLNFWIP